MSSSASASASTSSMPSLLARTPVFGSVYGSTPSTSSCICLILAHGLAATPWPIQKADPLARQGIGLIHHLSTQRSYHRVWRRIASSRASSAVISPARTRSACRSVNALGSRPSRRAEPMAPTNACGFCMLVTTAIVASARSLTSLSPVVFLVSLRYFQFTQLPALAKVTPFAQKSRGLPKKSGVNHSLVNRLQANRLIRYSKVLAVSPSPLYRVMCRRRRAMLSLLP